MRIVLDTNILARARCEELGVSVFTDVELLIQLRGNG